MRCFDRRWGVLALGVFWACQRSPLEPDTVSALSVYGGTLPPHCVDGGDPPRTLECTGLYADIATKKLAAGVMSYAPAVTLWSDGAEKDRWIQLPPGTTIDTTNPNEWVFPTGTKLWKQFSHGGKRIETRLWHKADDGFWVNAAYAWDADETEAPQTAGGDIPLGTGTYHIPTKSECEKCHRGRNENILGFDQVSLGLPGASGLTLAELVDRDLLSPPPASTHLTIGDDGTGLAAPVLGWIHANCGNTCHNANENSTGNGTKMHLRLDPSWLDGRSAKELDPIKTTVGVAVNTPNWSGRVRIVAGDPQSSLIYDLVSHRGEGMQMPPIATKLVDEAHATLIAEWIRRMVAPPAQGTGDPSGVAVP